MSSKQKKILYVEDEDKIRSVLIEYFETIGYSVVPAEEGNEALIHFLAAKSQPETPQFDIIITDINMPNGMGGIEFIKEVHKTDRDIPIIAISGYLKNSEYIQELPKDITYYSKPVSLKELTEKIKELSAA